MGLAARVPLHETHPWCVTPRRSLPSRGGAVARCDRRPSGQPRRRRLRPRAVSGARPTRSASPDRERAADASRLQHGHAARGQATRRRSTSSAEGGGWRDAQNPCRTELELSPPVQPGRKVSTDGLRPYMASIVAVRTSRCYQCQKLAIDSPHGLRFPCRPARIVRCQGID